MFEKTKYKIGIWIARRQELKNERPEIQTSKFLTTIKSIVVGLPPNNELLPEAIRYLKQSDLLKNKPLTIWYSGDQYVIVREEFPNAKLILKSELLYRKWFIPERKNLTGKFENHPDLIIDLSMDFQLDAVYIWTCFPNAYRVGLYGFEDDQFFDFVIKFKPETSYSDRLKKLETLFSQLK